MKHCDQRQLGEDRASFTFQLTREQERGAETMKEHCSFPHGLLSLLSYSTQDHQPDTTIRVVLHTVSWALAHQSLIKKMHHMLTNVVRAFSQLGFPLPK